MYTYTVKSFKKSLQIHYSKLYSSHYIQKREIYLQIINDSLEIFQTSSHKFMKDEMTIRRYVFKDHFYSEHL